MRVDLIKTIKLEIIDVELIKLVAKHKNIEEGSGVKSYRAGKIKSVEACHLALSLEIDLSNIKCQIAALEKERDRLQKEIKVNQDLHDRF